MGSDLTALVERLPGRNGPAAVEAIAAAERAVGSLPEDYKMFLRLVNGFEGSINDAWYLRLYRAEELAEMNAGYTVSQTRTGLVLFGTDGGGEGFCFDLKRNGPPVLMVNFIGDWREDALACGNGFSDFMSKVFAGWSPLQR